MSQDWYDDVLQFHRKFDHYLGTTPAVPDDGNVIRRLRLIREEYDELRYAIDDNDIPEIADGIADLIYVLLGTAMSYGIDLRPVWDEVQATNMAKAGKDGNGKTIKPPGWQPPDIAGILAIQGLIQ